MRTTVADSIEIGAPAARVFAVALAVDQFRGYANWNPAFARGIRIIEETEGIGTTFEAPLEAPGAIGRAEVTEYEPPSRMTARVRGGIFRDLCVRFTIEDTAQGSTLSLSMEYQLRYAPASWILDGVVLRGKMRASARAQLLAMKARAEFFERLAA